MKFYLSWVARRLLIGTSWRLLLPPRVVLKPDPNPRVSAACTDCLRSFLLPSTCVPCLSVQKQGRTVASTAASGPEATQASCCRVHLVLARSLLSFWAVNYPEIGRRQHHPHLTTTIVELARCITEILALPFEDYDTAYCSPTCMVCLHIRVCLMIYPLCVQQARHRPLQGRP